MNSLDLAIRNSDKMKILSFCIAFLFSITINAQQTTESWMYDGQMREYIQYVPSIYDENTAVPVVFVFHGLGDSMGNMFGIGMDAVADTANFIVITPQALADPLAGTAWNSLAGIAGVYFPNETVDDVGFVLAMLDTLSAQYNIDLGRVYATGFSMGGFFTNRLACEHPEVFKAVASVSGTIGSGLDCNPSEPIRIAHFHGTADQTVGYVNNTFGINVEEWFSNWEDANGCSGEVSEDPLPNPANDGFTIDYLRNANCSAESEVVLYRVNGAGHIWLTPSNDLFYTTEIWRFFLGVQPQLATSIRENDFSELNIYPNPTNGIVNLNMPEQLNYAQLQVFDNVGRLVSEAAISPSGIIDFSFLTSGIYHLRVFDDKAKYACRLVIE
jgi:polyhydroxybutyrate depolymerase